MGAELRQGSNNQQPIRQQLSSSRLRWRLSGTNWRPCRVRDNSSHLLHRFNNQPRLHHRAPTFSTSWLEDSLEPSQDLSPLQVSLDLSPLQLSLDLSHPLQDQLLHLLQEELQLVLLLQQVLQHLPLQKEAQHPLHLQEAAGPPSCSPPFPSFPTSPLPYHLLTSLVSRTLSSASWRAKREVMWRLESSVSGTSRSCLTRP